MTNSRLPGVLCACFGLLLGSLAHATAVPGQGSWETTLLPRDLDGNPSTIEAYYDTVLNITWLADANAAGSSTMNWYSAIAWAAGLNINGITGWRLPVVNPIDGTTADDQDISYIGTEDRGYNDSAPGTLYAGSTASEMAYMFYNTLGNLSWCDPATSTVSSCSGPQVTNPPTPSRSATSSPTPTGQTRRATVVPARGTCISTLATRAVALRPIQAPSMPGPCTTAMSAQEYHLNQLILMVMDYLII